MCYINKSIRKARYKRGMTQFELAQLVGCSESQIAKIETGRIKPSPAIRKAIVKALKIQWSEVLA